ncbi:hypothetical protein [Streptomyces sp. GbtcB7]|uniref:hypothetical protein n=1 Tax=Streptomyces sp. GbtcB7 TaxID=2824752 RepID=UPI001C3008D7|nr:hypothetical protein [Streptomyces sp. GbtcB7]
MQPPRNHQQNREAPFQFQLAGAKNAPGYGLNTLSTAAGSGHWAVLPDCPAPGAERRDVTMVTHRLGRLTEIFGTGSEYAELTCYQDR